MAGLTSTGLTIKNVDEILSDMEADQLANIDADLNVESDSVLGQLNGIYAGALYELWQLFEQIYQAAYPDTASGQSLSYVSAITGTVRQDATKSTVAAQLQGTVTTVVPAGTLAYPERDPDSVYEVIADATIEEHGATDYVNVTMEAVTPGSATRCYQTDSTLTIATPVSGLDVIDVSSEDSVAGLDEETDAELRLRRQQELATAAASTVEAIRAEILQVTGVDSCTVFENPSSVQDPVLGLPPYSIEVLVYSEGAPAYTAVAVRTAILQHKPAGTETFGLYSGVVVDSQGNSHTVKYSEPTEVPIYVALTLYTTGDGTYAGAAATANAIADWAVLNLEVGQSVHASMIIDVVQNLQGVDYVDVSTVKVEDTDPPTTADQELTGRQLGTIDSGDVDITIGT